MVLGMPFRALPVLVALGLPPGSIIATAAGASPVPIAWGVILTTAAVPVSSAFTSTIPATSSTIGSVAIFSASASLSG